MKLGAPSTSQKAGAASHRGLRSNLQAGAVLAAGSLVLAGCAAGGAGSTDDGSEAPAPDAESITLRLGHTNEDTHPNETCGASFVAEQVSEQTNGTLTIETFPSSQLGSNPEMAEQLARGDLDMQIMPVPDLAQYYPPVGALNAVYLFDSVEESGSVINGELGEELWTAALEESDIRVLGAWYYGARQLTTGDTPVRTPADLAGMSIRAIDNDIQIANISSMGADPTPVAFSELYLALQQGVVDGQENPIATTANSGLDEVQGYVMMTDHLFPWLPVAISEASWEKLSADQQEALEGAVLEAADKVRECIETEEAEILDQWRADGTMEIIEDVDREAFKEQSRAAFPGQFEDEWGDVYRQILEATAE